MWGNALKVSVIVPFDLSTIYGGARMRILNDIKALKLAGFNVEVLFPTEKRLNYLAIGKKEKVRCITFRSLLKGFNLPRGLISGRKVSLLVDNHTLAVSPFFHALLKKSFHKYDFILAHYPFAAFPTLRAIGKKRPIIHVNHDFQLSLARQVTRNWVYHAYIRYIEGYSCRNAERTLCVSNIDRESIIREYGLPKDKVLVLQNHINIRDYTTPLSTHTLRENYGFRMDDFLVLFHGAIDSRPNLDATKFILKELAPVLQRIAPHVKVLIVGARVPRLIMEEGAHAPNVFVRSNVPNLSIFLKMVDAMVAPISIGGGTRLKILEAFASHVPVIATLKAIEGLECLPGVHVLVTGRNAKKYAQMITRLHEDSSLRKSIATSAFNLVKSRYDVHVVAKLYDKILKDLA